MFETSPSSKGCSRYGAHRLMAEVLNRVNEIVSRVIEESSGQTVSLSPDDALLTSGYLDSLATLDLFAELQGEFGIELDVDDVTEETFANVSSIAELVRSRISQDAKATG